MEIEGSIYLLEEQAGFEADAALVKVGSESLDACTAVRMRTAPADGVDSMAAPIFWRFVLESFRSWARRSGSISIVKESFKVAGKFSG